MSRSGRRRGSKWDLDEGSEPREPSASRGSERHENNSKERVMAWDEDGDRRRMSPELDEWRHRRNDLPNKARGFSHRSTGSGSRSRSQSRSPPHNFRREPRFSDQNRIRSRVSAQLCRDLAAGRCRRGNHCPFLHDGAEQYDGRRHSESSFTERESRRRNTDGSRRSPDDIGDYPTRNARSVQCCNDFLKGKCRWGASCRYVHDEHVTDGFAKGSLDDVDRPADNDRRSRGTYPDSHQESPRGGEPVCKYFAAGNCRNGRYCRFSHQRRSVSPWRSRDGTLGQDSELDAKWGDPKWNDATDNSNVQVVGWDEVKTGIKGEGDNFSNRDMVNTSTWGAPSSPGEPMLRDENQSFQWTRHNERSMAVAEPNDAENIPVDMEMESPEGNDKPYNIFSPNLLSPPSPPISFPASSNDKTQEAALEKQFSTGLPQPKVSDDPYLQRNLGVGEGPSSLYTVDNNNSTGNGNSSNSAVLVQGFTLNDHNVGVQPVSNFNAVGQKQPSLPSYPSGSDAVQTPHNKTNIIGNKTAMEPNFVGPNTTAHGTSSHGNVTGEQLAQLSHLSASLSQLLENRQQLPQLSSLPDSSAPIPPVSAANFPTNQATVSMKQYDPLCVNIELENPNTGNSLFPTSTEEKSSSHGIMGIPEVLGDGVPVQAGLPNAKLDQSNSNKNGMAERIDKASEDGPVDDLAEDNGADDGRKVKDSKGVRPFKFALAEFVKELLRPTWKDGQVSKEVYKTIVKKAVDKVIDTFQEAHIPQTKEKIDQYLSFSRPKLTKLVQAYVEKYGKSKPKV